MFLAHITPKTRFNEIVEYRLDFVQKQCFFHVCIKLLKEHIKYYNNFHYRLINIT